MNQSVTKWQYRFGLVGQRLDYSFSPTYFAALFRDLGLSTTHSYVNWEHVDDDSVIAFFDRRPFEGCNVTIPYKQVAAKQCDVLIGFAAQTGAVNTIKNEDGVLIGYNTDVYGVLETINHKYMTIKYLDKNFIYKKKHVLVLGSGGASLAVQAGCSFLKWNCKVVSRKEGSDETYLSLAQNRDLSEFDIIVNTTPLGMSTLLSQKPDIQYDQLTPNHLVFDVIYNPKKSLFLGRAEEAGANIVNGELMLQEQANLAWEIWNH